MIRKFANILLPSGSWRREVAKKTLVFLQLHKQPSEAYHGWFVRFENSYYPKEDSNSGQLISVIVPCFNTQPDQLLEMIHSVTNQLYQNWELILVNASSDSVSRASIKKTERIDRRIKVVNTKNRGIANNTNKGIEIARGEYIAFLDHDDTLPRFALSEVNECIKHNPSAGMIYSDEDKVTATGDRYFNPFFKPDFSPDLLANVNYITHFTVIRKDLIKVVGGLDPSCDGSQDYDLFLKIADLGTQVVHIPKILYHWRATKGSTALDISSKEYVMDAGVKAVKNHIKRTKREAAVRSIEKRPNFIRVSYKQSYTSDLVFMPDNNLAQRSVYIKEFIHNSANLNFEKIYCPSNIILKNEITKLSPKVVFVDCKHYLNNVNKLSRSQSLLIINNYVEFKQKNWLDNLNGALAGKDVFSVSPIIIDQNNRIKDGGYVWIDKLLVPFLKGAYLDHDSMHGHNAWVRNLVCASTDVQFILRQNLQKVLEENVDIFDPIQHAKYTEKNGLSDILWSHIRAELLADDTITAERGVKLETVSFEPASMPEFGGFDYE